MESRAGRRNRARTCRPARPESRQGRHRCVRARSAPRANGSSRHRVRSWQRASLLNSPRPIPHSVPEWDAIDLSAWASMRSGRDHAISHRKGCIKRHRTRALTITLWQPSNCNGQSRIGTRTNVRRGDQKERSRFTPTLRAVALISAQASSESGTPLRARFARLARSGSPGVRISSPGMAFPCWNQSR
jgi:hypothetical protein